MWRGPEMKPVWAHVEARLREANGQILQPTGMWEKDYDVLLAELTEAEKSKEDERLREEEDAERTKALSSEGEWTAVIERFEQRNVPGIRVMKGKNQTSLAIALSRAGMVFLVAGVRDYNSSAVSGWQVSSRVAPGRSTTKLEQAVLECLNSRPRKWDLAFLLVCTFTRPITKEKLTSVVSVLILTFSLGDDCFVCRYQANALYQV